MRGSILVTGIAIVALGCSGTANKGGNPNGGGGGGGGTGSGGAGGSGTGGGSVTPPPDGGSGPFSVSIGPIPVDSGKETVQCITVKMPTTTEVDIVGIATTLAPGSHHLIVYTSTATTESPTPTTCTSFDGVLQGQQPLFIADSLGQAMTLPTGVSYHFPAGQMIEIEAHYINATPTALQGMGTIQFTTGSPAMTYQPANIMMCGSVAALTACIPPGQANYTLPVSTYTGSSSVDFTKLHVFAMTTHEHRRGTDVKIWQATSANPTQTMLLDNPNWDNPALKVYDSADVLNFNAGDGLSWQCSYNTSADSKPVCFGESAQTNEMCFIWAYYYPSVGRFIGPNDCWK